MSIPGAHFAISICTIPEQQFICNSEDWEELTSGWTNSSGDFAFDCQGDEYWVNTATHAGQNAFQVVNGAMASAETSKTTVVARST